MTKGNAFRYEKIHTNMLTQLHGYAFSNSGKHFCSNVHCHMQLHKWTREVILALKKMENIRLHGFDVKS